MIVKDRQGHALTGATMDAADSYEDAIRAFNLYLGDPVAYAAEAIEKAPDFVMAHILTAWLMALAAEPEGNAEAARIIDEVSGYAMDEREASHLAALKEVVRGNWSRAAICLDFHSARYPRDLLALQAGILCDFYRANSRNLRDRVLRALPAWTPDIPGYSVVVGFSSFGLEECGNYARAEEAGRKAIDMEHRDCWAHHAVAHVMEMQGRPDDGVAWMTEREESWAQPENFFKVHNWWHRALFHIDLGQVDQAVGIYDKQIRADGSTVAIDMVDASAMLWRLNMSDVDVGDRWAELARGWDMHADGRLYCFNDLHGVMAWLGAGRESDVEKLIASWKALEPVSESDRWSKTIGLPLAEGFLAWWRRDYQLAAELLHGNRHIFNAFGGSHAQRDIIDWTMTDAAIRSGNPDIALAFARERSAIKPDSAINRGLLDRALTLSDKLSAAA